MPTHDHTLPSALDSARRENSRRLCQRPVLVPGVLGSGRGTGLKYSRELRLILDTVTGPTGQAIATGAHL